MTWNEFGASFIYGLPDFGDGMAKDIFPKEDYERFDYSNPNGFYRVGRSSLRKQVIEEAGAHENHLSHLVENYIVADMVQHIVATLSLTWRGMWVSKYWGLITIPLFLGVFIYALRRRWYELLIFSIPPWFMLGFHAFTSVNVVRYNLILIPCLAVAAAFVLVNIYDHLTNKEDNLA